MRDDDQKPTPPALAFKVGTAADRLEVSPKTIYRLIKNGRLKSIRVGRALRVEAESLKSFGR